MKITKYPQSCLIIEDQGKRLAIDPGSFVKDKYPPTALLPLDGILITHEHVDHADPEFLRALVAAQPGLSVVANQGTANLLGTLVTQVVADSEMFELAGIRIMARELPHCLSPDGSDGPQNTGYLVNEAFFHPGDGIAIDNLQTPATAVPIVGPDISPKDVFDFIKQVGCKVAIPIHYDYYTADPNLMAKLATTVTPGVRFVVLEHEQSIEV